MYGVFQTYYTYDIAETSSDSAISWIGSMQVFLLCFIGTVVGPIYDAGHLHLLLVSGTVLTLLGVFTTSICKTYWQLFLAQGLVTGCGFGCLFLPGVTIVSQYFTTKRGFATGVASLGSSIGKSSMHRSSLQLRLYLIQSRRCGLSHYLDPTSACHRIWLGNTSHWFHNHGNSHSPPCDHAPPPVPKEPQISFRPRFIERYTLPFLRVWNILWLHGHLRGLLLRPTLRHGPSRHELLLGVLSPRYHQCRIFTRSDTTQFCSGLCRATEHADGICWCICGAQSVVDSHWKHSRYNCLLRFVWFLHGNICQPASSNNR